MVEVVRAWAGSGLDRKSECSSSLQLTRSLMLMRIGVLMNEWLTRSSMVRCLFFVSKSRHFDTRSCNDSGIDDGSFKRSHS